MKSAASSAQILREILHSYRRVMQGNEITALRTTAYQRELYLLGCIQSGNEAVLSLLMQMPAGDSFPVGDMSDSPLRNAQYAAVSGITLITRYAVAGGLPASEAYSLSDAYIQQIDSCRQPADVRRILYLSVPDFTHRVRLAKTRAVTNYPVVRCVRYISENLSDPLTLSALAGYCKVTPQYLSTAFHREMGVTLVAYIRREKLQAAAQLLVQSAYPVRTIASFLSFGTASSFAAAFRAQYGMTPREWRSRYSA